MRTRVVIARLLVLGVLALAAYGYWQGTPQDVVSAVRAGDVDELGKAVRRDPAAVHTQVYPQAYERQSQRAEYQSRHGQSPWEGRYLIHDAVQRRVDPIPMLDALAAAGADLTVRLNGRTLLHMAARDGNLEVVRWLIDRGADIEASNDCTAPCPERGQTPLHDSLAFNDDAMTALLLARGAAVDAFAANGQSALHVAASTGQLGGAFVLCRHGADPARRDAVGKTPADLASALAVGPDANQAPAEGLVQLARWLKPQGGCAAVAATARSTRSPVSDDDARKVFAETVLRP